MALRSMPRKLLRSWLVSGLSWYSITEGVARVLLEGGFILLLLTLGFSPLIVFVSWVLLHTGLWILPYGGFLIVWKLLHFKVDIARLKAYLDHIGRKVGLHSALRLVILYGSGARGELNERSDIDLLVVPELSLPLRIRAILFWWRLRAGAALRRIPVEARWIDAERFVPYHVSGESQIVLRRSHEPRDLPGRLAARGWLVAFSGIDGSGKTTIARELVSSLRARGFNAVYFYGHRPAYLRDGSQISFAIAFKSFWKRAGRTLAELERHRWAKIVFDVTTLLDYIYVQWKLSRQMGPNTVVVSDRYVADVIASIRFLGPVKTIVSGLLVRYSYEPDVAIFFEIKPEQALNRKQEQTLAELEKFAGGYSDLRERLRLVTVDAGRTLSEVKMQVWGIVERDLPLAQTGVRPPP